MFKRYFIAGLLVWLPLVVTIFVLKFLIDLVDGSLRLLPLAYQPDQLLGFHIPGLGVIFTFLCVFLTGLLVTNIVGDKLVKIGEKILNKIPLVRSVYTAAKQVVSTVFSTSGESFRKVLLIEYPRKGLWSIAFQTSKGFQEVNDITGETLVTVFVPTTPNPTSGFLLLVPEKDVKELDISVDSGLKMVISLGVVLPEAKVAELLEKNA